MFIPIFYEFGLSFTDYNLLSAPKFNGISNYAYLLFDTEFWDTLWRTFVYGVEVVIPSLVIAFIMAWMMSRVRHGQALFLAALFIPFVVPTVASSIIFELIMQRYGLLNSVLHTNFAWLTDPSIAMAAVSIATVWSTVGYYVVIFLAGLQQIAEEILDAARIDGATSFQTIRHVILPSMRPTILFASVMCLASVITNFSTPYVLTQGGPDNATLIAPLLIWKMAFKYYQAGGAAAMAFVLLIISSFLTWIQFRLLRES